MQVGLSIPFKDMSQAKAEESNLDHTAGRIITLAQERNNTLKDRTEAIKSVLMEVIDNQNNKEDFDLKDHFIEELEAANEKLLFQLASISSEHNFLKNHFKELQDKTDQLKNQQEILNEAYQQVAHENALHFKESEDSKKKYVDLKAKFQLLKESYVKLSAQNLQIVSSTAGLADDYAELKLEYDELINQNQTLKGETDLLKKSYQQLNGKYDGLETENNELQTMVDDLTEDFAQLKKLLDKIEGINKQLKNELEKQTKKSGVWESNDYCRTFKHLLWLGTPAPIQIICLYATGKMNELDS